MTYTNEEGIEFKEGDIVFGDFEYDEGSGVVKFGEFDAYWPTGAHESALAYGLYVETEFTNEYGCWLNQYSIVQIENLKHPK